MYRNTSIQFGDINNPCSSERRENASPLFVCLSIKMISNIKFLLNLEFVRIGHAIQGIRA